MLATEPKSNMPAHFHAAASKQPFFNKGQQNFFSGTNEADTFFPGQTHVHHSASNVIQRQEQPETPPTKENEQGPQSVPLTRPSRAAGCVKDPRFPDFGCFTTQLKLDVDENLVNNAHQFIRVATLFPGNNEMMWNTFLRYGLGVNLLETSFGFTGVNKKWGSILSYGVGVGMKSYQFFKGGELKLDIPIPLGNGINLDIKFDLKTDPHNLGNKNDVDTSIGISGRF